MLDLPKSLRDIIAVSWNDPYCDIYNTQVEPIDGDSLDIRVLTKELSKQSGYEFQVNANALIHISVKLAVGYRERLDLLLDLLLNILFTNADFYTKFGINHTYSINYSYESRGESNFATASVRFNLMYLDSITAPIFQPLTSIHGAIDLGAPDGKIDEYI